MEKLTQRAYANKGWYQHAMDTSHAFKLVETRVRHLNNCLIDAPKFVTNATKARIELAIKRLG